MIAPTKKPALQHMHRILSVSVSELQRVGQKAERWQVTEEVSVGLSSMRLQTFKKNKVCTSCGIHGAFLSVERHARGARSGEDGYHINMYALTPEGHYVLMTRDHKHPKSKRDMDVAVPIESLANSATMCSVCNSKKAAMTMEEFDEWKATHGQHHQPWQPAHAGFRAKIGLNR